MMTLLGHLLLFALLVIMIINIMSPQKKIGLTWLNYIVENETILWWGGVGNSTEHTAFQNLKNGIHAPHSGSIKNNGKNYR